MEENQELQKSKTTIPQVELGTTGLDHQGGYIYEEFLPQLRWPQAAKVYQEMADNDPIIGAVLYLCEMLIRRVEWSVRPAGKTEADIQAAKFLEECLGDMEHSWADFICEALSCLTYGWSFHEICYKVRKGPKEKDPKFRSEFTDLRIGWAKMPVRSQSTLHSWEVDDETGNVTAMVQQAPPRYKTVTIPLSKGLLFKTKAQRGNPEGRSLLRNAYRPWYFKKRIEEIEGVGIERDLAGLPTLTPPENINIWDTTDPESVKLRNMATRLIRDVRRDRSDGVVLPHGWELKLLTTGGSRQFDTNAIINRYDQRIAITLLADIVLLGSNNVGSYAMAEVKQSMLAQSLESILKSMVDTINKTAVPQLFELNFFPGITSYPTIVPGDVEVPNLKDLGEYFQRVGLKIDDDYELSNYIRTVASMPTQTKEQFDIMQQKREELRNRTQNATNQHQDNMLDGQQTEEGYQINRAPGVGPKEGRDDEPSVQE